MSNARDSYTLVYVYTQWKIMHSMKILNHAVCNVVGSEGFSLHKISQNSH